MLPIYKKLLRFLVIFLGVWLTGSVLLPLFLPFGLGLALALAAEPMVRFLCKNLHFPQVLSTFLGVSAAFCFLTLLLIFFLAFLVREMGYLARVLPDLEQTAINSMTFLKNRLLDITAMAPGSIRTVVQDSITDFFSGGTALLGRIAGFLLGLAGDILSHIPDSILTLGTAVISGYMISAKLPRLRVWLRKRLPKQKLSHLLEMIRQTKNTLVQWFLAQCKLTGITLLILSAGFLLLRIRYGLLWALGVCLVDAFPVLGTGTILLPWALVCYLQGDTARGIGLMGIYGVVSLTRSMLEPKLVGSQLGLDPLATLVALYAGYKLWGIGGMILSPILTVTILQLLPDGRNPAA